MKDRYVNRESGGIYLDNTSWPVLRRAVELGVNFMDTADSYGPNVSEELIAKALAPYLKDLVIAGSLCFSTLGFDSNLVVRNTAGIR